MAFRVKGPYQAKPSIWRLQPMEVSVLSDDGSGGGFYVIRALQILPSGQTVHCLMDVSFPERINDYAYFVHNGRLRYNYTHKFPGKIIPAIAFDCFGLYELFHAETAPDIGIDALRRGLAVCPRKRFIAQDLGYILRDEKRYREAAEMFELVAAEEVSSHYTYGELAQLYEKLGDVEREAKYRSLYDQGRA